MRRRLSVIAFGVFLIAYMAGVLMDAAWRFGALG